MPKLTLNDLTSGYQTLSVYNANNTAIENAVENTLSRDGTTPNQMEANLDMNSNNVTNVQDLTATGQIAATSLLLNGEVVTAVQDLAGGLDANSVTFTPTNPAGPATTLQAALDDDYLRNDRNEALVGNFDVTGDITVSGTVDGRDVAADGATLDALGHAAAPASHVRAGNTYLRNGDDNFDIFDVFGNVAAATWETIGPTGSGATNIWAIMDVVPATARILIVEYIIGVSTNGVNGASAALHVASGDSTTTGANTGNRLCQFRIDDDAAITGSNLITGIGYIPLDSSQVWQARYVELFSDDTTIAVGYRGYITDV